MEKIIFLSNTPLTKKDENDFYMQDIINTGISVEFVDISRIFLDVLTVYGSVNRDYVRNINSWDSLDLFLQKENHTATIFVPLINNYFSNKKVFRLLKKYNCTLILFQRDGMPIYRIGLIKEIKKWVRNSTKLNVIARRVFARIFKPVGFLEGYDAAFVSGHKAKSLFSKKSMVIGIHHFNYDLFLETKDKKSTLVGFKYGVFLDQFLPYHPDFHLDGTKTINPEAYYKSLNKFFDFLKNKFNFDIVIAAHPKSDYATNPFNGREIFVNKTCELVKDCELVVGHTSTSVNFAVLSEKPVLFTYTNDIRNLSKGFFFNSLQFIAGALNAAVYNMDEIEENKVRIPRINLKLYRKYKYDYLVSKESEGQNSKDIVLSSLKLVGNKSKSEVRAAS